MTLLWHRLRSGHQLYFLGRSQRRAYFECECGRSFRTWAP